MRRKWIITAVVAIIFCVIGGVYKYYKSSASNENSGKPANKAQTGNILNVNGRIIRTQTLTDDLTMVGNLLPDEEVDLTFETSGKIIEINLG